MGVGWEGVESIRLQKNCDKNLLKIILNVKDVVMMLIG